LIYIFKVGIRATLHIQLKFNNGTIMLLDGLM